MCVCVCDHRDSQPTYSESLTFWFFFIALNAFQSLIRRFSLKKDSWCIKNKHLQVHLKTITMMCKLFYCSVVFHKVKGYYILKLFK